jgi:hypothetical protein
MLEGWMARFCDNKEVGRRHTTTAADCGAIGVRTGLDVTVGVVEMAEKALADIVLDPERCLAQGCL